MSFNVIQASVFPSTLPVTTTKIVLMPRMNTMTALTPALTMEAALTLVSPHPEALYASATLDTT